MIVIGLVTMGAIYQEYHIARNFRGVKKFCGWTIIKIFAGKILHVGLRKIGLHYIFEGKIFEAQQ